MNGEGGELQDAHLKGVIAAVDESKSQKKKRENLQKKKFQGDQIVHDFGSGLPPGLQKCAVEDGHGGFCIWSIHQRSKGTLYVEAGEDGGFKNTNLKPEVRKLLQEGKAIPRIPQALRYEDGRTASGERRSLRNLSATGDQAPFLYPSQANSRYHCAFAPRLPS